MAAKSSPWTLGRSRIKSDDLTPQEQLTINRLARWYRLSVARRFLPDDRLSFCYRSKLREFVDLYYSKQYSRAHYGGLMVCGSVWNCPVCAAKITERRRLEIQQLLDKASAAGYSFFLATFTLQHSKEDSLTHVRSCLTDALEKTKSGRWWGDFSKQYGIIGNVAKSEVTYGVDFGWHFHKHLLFITSESLNAEKCASIRSELSDRYREKIANLGGYAHPIYGLDVRVGDNYIGDYIAKYGYEPSPAWSLAAEVSKGFSKVAKPGDHYTPFQLLDYLGTDSIFKEYAASMRGYNQLRWSNGLRKRFDLGVVVSDEELATAQDEDAFLFAQITDSQWEKIVSRDYQGQLLEVASSGNLEHFQIFLRSL